MNHHLPKRNPKQQKLTIQGSLADGHDQCGEKHQNCFGDAGPRDDLFVVAPEQSSRISKDVQVLGRGLPDHGQVIKVHDRLRDIQRRLCGREPAVAVPSRPAIDVVNRPVQRVRLPDGQVVFPARHGMRPEEDIARVPHHQRQRDGQPDDEHGRDLVSESRVGHNGGMASGRRVYRR